jgi:hypothetical protein
VGHLKFLVQSDTGLGKVSYGCVPEHDRPPMLAMADCNRIDIVVNARAEMSPPELRAVVETSLDLVKSKYDVEITEKNISAFQPGHPRPTYRFP